MNNIYFIIKADSIAQLCTTAYRPEGKRFESWRLLVFYYSIIYLNCQLMEKYRIIHMFHVGSIHWNITSIQIYVIKVCLQIDLSKG
jgi:hypothetical protein